MNVHVAERPECSGLQAGASQPRSRVTKLRQVGAEGLVGCNGRSLPSRGDTVQLNECAGIPELQPCVLAFLSNSKARPILCSYKEALWACEAGWKRQKTQAQLNFRVAGLPEIHPHEL